jgi:hypothetical protein
MRESPRPRSPLVTILRDVVIAVGAFAAVSGLAVLLDAANLGTALAFGQIAFVAAVTWVLVRR